MDIAIIKKTIASGMDERATVIVESQDGHHFSAVVVSDDFAGKSRIDRQRQVFQLVGDMIATGELHALSLKTYTEEEWRARELGTNS